MPIVLSPQDLARALEREHACEECHHVQSVCWFDNRQVCAHCWRELERLLLREREKARR